MTPRPAPLACSAISVLTSIGSCRPQGDILTGNVARAWNAGKAVHALAADDPALDTLLGAADVVFDTPGIDGTHQLDPASRAGRGLGAHHAVRTRRPARVMARVRSRRDGGQRKHVLHGRSRSSARSLHRTHAYAHSGPEAAFAALTALWSGVPQPVDVSMQEVVITADMIGPARFPQRGIARFAPRRQHRPHPGDLADERRVRVVRPAGWQGPGREPRADREARGTAGPRLDQVEREHRDRRRARRSSKSRSVRTSRSTRCGSCTRSRARPT